MRPWEKIESYTVFNFPEHVVLLGAFSAPVPGAECGSGVEGSSPHARAFSPCGARCRDARGRAHGVRVCACAGRVAFIPKKFISEEDLSRTAHRHLHQQRAASSAARVTARLASEAATAAVREATSDEGSASRSDPSGGKDLSFEREAGGAASTAAPVEKRTTSLSILGGILSSFSAALADSSSGKEPAQTDAAILSSCALRDAALCPTSVRVYQRCVTSWACLEDLRAELQRLAERAGQRYRLWRLQQTRLHQPLLLPEHAPQRLWAVFHALAARVSSTRDDEARSSPATASQSAARGIDSASLASRQQPPTREAGDAESVASFGAGAGASGLRESGEGVSSMQRALEDASERKAEERAGEGERCFLSCGIVGAIRFLMGFYLVLATESQQVATLGCVRAISARAPPGDAQAGEGRQGAASAETAAVKEISRAQEERRASAYVLLDGAKQPEAAAAGGHEHYGTGHPVYMLRHVHLLPLFYFHSRKEAAFSPWLQPAWQAERSESAAGSNRSHSACSPSKDDVSSEKEAILRWLADVAHSDRADSSHTGERQEKLSPDSGMCDPLHAPRDARATRPEVRRLSAASNASAEDATDASRSVSLFRPGVAPLIAQKATPAYAADYQRSRAQLLESERKYQTLFLQVFLSPALSFFYSPTLDLTQSAQASGLRRAQGTRDVTHDEKVNMRGGSAGDGENREDTMYSDDFQGENQTTARLELLEGKKLDAVFNLFLLEPFVPLTSPSSRQAPPTCLPLGPSHPLPSSSSLSSTKDGRETPNSVCDDSARVARACGHSAILPEGAPSLCAPGDVAEASARRAAGRLQRCAYRLAEAPRAGQAPCAGLADMSPWLLLLQQGCVVQKFFSASRPVRARARLRHPHGTRTGSTHLPSSEGTSSPQDSLALATDSLLSAFSSSPSLVPSLVAASSPPRSAEPSSSSTLSSAPSASSTAARAAAASRRGPQAALEDASATPLPPTSHSAAAEPTEPTRLQRDVHREEECTTEESRERDQGHTAPASLAESAQPKDEIRVLFSLVVIARRLRLGAGARWFRRGLALPALPRAAGAGASAPTTGSWRLAAQPPPSQVSSAASLASNELAAVADAVSSSAEDCAWPVEDALAALGDSAVAANQVECEQILWRVKTRSAGGRRKRSSAETRNGLERTSSSATVRQCRGPNLDGALDASSAASASSSAASPRAAVEAPPGGERPTRGKLPSAAASPVRTASCGSLSSSAASPRVFFSGDIAAVVQLRGSVPVFWGHLPTQASLWPPFLQGLSPPLRLSSATLDPRFLHTKGHFDALHHVYGCPILCLDLVRQQPLNHMETKLASTYRAALAATNEMYRAHRRAILRRLQQALAQENAEDACRPSSSASAASAAGAAAAGASADSRSGRDTSACAPETPTGVGPQAEPNQVEETKGKGKQKQECRLNSTGAAHMEAQAEFSPRGGGNRALCTPGEDSAHSPRELQEPEAEQAEAAAVLAEEISKDARDCASPLPPEVSSAPAGFRPRAVVKEAVAKQKAGAGSRPTDARRQRGVDALGSNDEAFDPLPGWTGRWALFKQEAGGGARPADCHSTESRVRSPSCWTHDGLCFRCMQSFVGDAGRDAAPADQTGRPQANRLQTMARALSAAQRRACCCEVAYEAFDWQDADRRLGFDEALQRLFGLVATSLRLTGSFVCFARSSRRRALQAPAETQPNGDARGDWTSPKDATTAENTAHEGRETFARGSRPCNAEGSLKVHGPGDAASGDRGGRAEPRSRYTAPDGDIGEDGDVAAGFMSEIQQGVIRINCVDCLDRTNLAMLGLGVAALYRHLTTLLRSRALQGGAWTFAREEDIEEREKRSFAPSAWWKRAMRERPATREGEVEGWLGEDFAADDGRRSSSPRLNETSPQTAAPAPTETKREGDSRSEGGHAAVVHQLPSSASRFLFSWTSSFDSLLTSSSDSEGEEGDARDSTNDTTTEGSSSLGFDAESTLSRSDSDFSSHLSAAGSSVDLPASASACCWTPYSPFADSPQAPSPPQASAPSSSASPSAAARPSSTPLPAPAPAASVSFLNFLPTLLLQIVGEAWGEVGDALAQQYGGSPAMHAADFGAAAGVARAAEAQANEALAGARKAREARSKGDRGKAEEAEKRVWRAVKRSNVLIAVQRYFNNCVYDADKQRGLDLFVGLFRPYASPTDIWLRDPLDPFSRFLTSPALPLPPPRLLFPLPSPAAVKDASAAAASAGGERPRGWREGRRGNEEETGRPAVAGSKAGEEGAGVRGRKSRRNSDPCLIEGEEFFAAGDAVSSGVCWACRGIRLWSIH
ncbi:hypothetical protein BESB_003140 [Besnoitia besnoiti]|uniref:SAC domain-containing protein n=1 Tax=Besnoitia besnoiti TaxID=94643 RepID=A0A2A9MPI2_BESBE|nr:hypothetical protein BESB_003140 [Besnoitia besnoiti]PFH37973.1 hypothetical protein BESB_003140 [Besnoitia besnoiti]